MQYGASSVEFRLLRARHFAELSYLREMDRTALHQWVYLLYADASEKDAQGLKKAIEDISRRMTRATNKRLGHHVPDEKPTRKEDPDSPEKQRLYLEALGDQPFSSLHDIQARVNELNSQIESMTNDHS